MASAADLPTAFAKAERAAGRPLPGAGTAFLSVRDADKPGVVLIAAALAGLGFELVATGGHRPHAPRRGSRGRRGCESGRRGGGRAHCRRPDSRAPKPRPRRQHASRLGRASRRLSDPRGGARRPRAVHHHRRGRRGRGARDRQRPRGERASCRSASASKRDGDRDTVSLRSSAPRASSWWTPSSTTGRTSCFGSSAAGSTRARPGSSSCSKRPAAWCRGRCRFRSRRSASSASCSSRSGPVPARSPT